MSGILQVSLTQLLPSLVGFLAKIASRSEIKPVYLGLVTEVLKTFGGIVGLVSAEQSKYLSLFFSFFFGNLFTLSSILKDMRLR